MARGARGEGDPRGKWPEPRSRGLVEAGQRQGRGRALTSDAPAIGQAPVECAGDCSSATCAPSLPAPQRSGPEDCDGVELEGEAGRRGPGELRALVLTWPGKRSASRAEPGRVADGSNLLGRDGLWRAPEVTCPAPGGRLIRRPAALRFPGHGQGDEAVGERDDDSGWGRWSRPSEMKGGHALIGRLLKPQKRPPKAPILSGRGADWAERVANRNSSTTARRSADRGTTYRPERSRDSPQASRATARALEGRRTSPTNISTGWTMWQTAGPLEQTTDGGPPGDEPRRMRLGPVEASVCTPLSSTPPPSVTAGSMQVRPELLESRSRHRDGCRFPGVVDLGGVASHLLRRVFSRGPPRPKTPRARPASKAG